MGTLKVTSWNGEWLDKLLEPASTPSAQGQKDERLVAIADEVRRIAPDILCLMEGPNDETEIGAFAQDTLGGEWSAVKSPDGVYGMKGRQWTWFLVRAQLAPLASILPIGTWDALAGSSWDVHYWGVHEREKHRHYRHPQVLVLDWHGQRVEFIGLHLKSKFISAGKTKWNAGGETREEFVEDAIKARIKLATEASNVRAYIDSKFEQVANPALFVMGDLNDGPGKEYFEDQYLFFDLLSNIQGDVFFARRFLNHALFDAPEHLRWTVDFQDFVQPERDRHILLDHILFTQGLVDGSLSLQINEHAGLVEHEIHELVNAGKPSYARTSDHRPVSVVVTTAD
jgi:hypothetical protein